MRKAVLPLSLLAAGAALATAQRTIQEVATPVTKEQDSKPNSPSVPNVYAISGDFKRIVVLRLKYETDLLAGIEEAVKDENIQNAVILAGAGSLRNYHIHSVGNRTFPSKNIHVKDPTGPADLASMNGYIVNGRVHAHVMLTCAEKAFGGHLEPGTNVFTFAIVTLGVFGDNVDLKRIDDKTYR